MRVLRSRQGRAQHAWGLFDERRAEGNGGSSTGLVLALPPFEEGLHLRSGHLCDKASTRGRGTCVHGIRVGPQKLVADWLTRCPNFLLPLGAAAQLLKVGPAGANYDGICEQRAGAGKAAARHVGLRGLGGGFPAVMRLLDRRRMLDMYGATLGRAQFRCLECPYPAYAVVEPYRWNRAELLAVQAACPKQPLWAALAAHICCGRMQDTTGLATCVYLRRSEGTSVVYLAVPAAPLAQLTQKGVGPYKVCAIADCSSGVCAPVSSMLRLCSGTGADALRQAKGGAFSRAILAGRHIAGYRWETGAYGTVVHPG